MIRILLGIDKEVWDLFVSKYKKDRKSFLSKIKDMIHNDVRINKYR